MSGKFGKDGVRCIDCKLCNKAISFCNRIGKIVDLTVKRTCKYYE